MPQHDTDVSNTRLVLAVGTRAGREAALQNGYYMIGRHRECQIRPKSRSVSRRHCLLLRDESGLRVFDLGSKAGTRINDLRLRPRIWQRLQNGDMLRCGKVAFEISLGDETVVGAALGVMADPGSAPEGEPATDDQPEHERLMQVGEAWQDVDIAGFLSNEDDADRERRYHRIRDASAAEDQGSDPEDSQTTAEMDVDGRLLEDPQAVTGVGAHDAPVDRSRGRATVADRVHDEAALGESGNHRRTKRGKLSGGGGPADIPKPKQRSLSKGFASPRPSFSPPDMDRLKLIALALLAIVVLGGFARTAHKFYNGPTVRVLQNID